MDQLAFVAALPPPGAAVVTSTPAPVVQRPAVLAVQGSVMPPPQVPGPILPVTLPLAPTVPVSQLTTTAPSTMQIRLTPSDLSSIAQAMAGIIHQLARNPL